MFLAALLEYATNSYGHQSFSAHVSCFPDLFPLSSHASTLIPRVSTQSVSVSKAEECCSGLCACAALFLPIRGVSAATHELEDDPASAKLSSGYRKAFTNEWAVRIAGGDEEEARSLANKYGYIYLGRVSPSSFLHHKSAFRVTLCKFSRAKRAQPNFRLHIRGKLRRH